MTKNPTYLCPHCTVTFAKTATLNKHMKSKGHGWTCSVCKCPPWDNIKGYNKHLRKVHPKKTQPKKVQLKKGHPKHANKVQHERVISTASAANTDAPSGMVILPQAVSQSRAAQTAFGLYMQSTITSCDREAVSNASRDLDIAPHVDHPDVKVERVEPAATDAESRGVVLDTPNSPSPSPTSSRISCKVCSSEPRQPTTTMCGHLFCHSCIVRALSQNLKCPVCDTAFLVRLNLD
ncbi:hypothetical protein BC629DRAFT_77701 [Irpex lacteus]|nr:hypothetical protein BC629DRAFT_77701 [Irpex lacteus]